MTASSCHLPWVAVTGHLVREMAVSSRTVPPRRGPVRADQVHRLQLVVRPSQPRWPALCILSIRSIWSRPHLPHQWGNRTRCLEREAASRERGLPVAEPMQRSLVAVLAARCVRRWTVHTTADQVFDHIHEVRAVPGVAGGAAWRLQRADRRDREVMAAQPHRPSRRLPRPGDDREPAAGHERLAAGPVADELARRQRPPASRRAQSYGGETIVAAARRMFRAALLRIEANAEHLERWRRCRVGVVFAQHPQQWPGTGAGPSSCPW